MKLGRKKMAIIVTGITVVLLATYIILNMAGIIDYRWSVLLFILLYAVAGGLILIQKRVDPEAYKADLKEQGRDYQAEEEISHIKIRRTWGGTICEFITAIMLVVSWILILRDHLSLAQDGFSLMIIGLCTIGAIWFHVTAYFHKTMGFPSKNVKQLKMCIYRKRALGIICGAFLLCYCLYMIPYGNTGTWGMFLLFQLIFLFGVIFIFKFYMNSVKK